MIKRKLAVIGGTLASLVIVVGGVEYYALATIDDPRFFCQAPNPSAHIVAAPGSGVILRGCDAGKTVIVARGQTVAIELPIGQSIDRGGIVYSDVIASDPSVLSTVTPPEQVIAKDDFYGSSVQTEEVAVYLASHAGQAALSAVSRVCLDACSRGHRWKVSVRVT